MSLLGKDGVTEFTSVSIGRCPTCVTYCIIWYQYFPIMKYNRNIIVYQFYILPKYFLPVHEALPPSILLPHPSM